MNYEALQNTLKSKSNEIKRKTISLLVEHNEDYKNACKKQGNAEKDYLRLNLSKKQKTTIDNLLTWTAECNKEYSSLNYLAGLYDHHKFPNISENKSIQPFIKGQTISSFYNGMLVPTEIPFESKATSCVWEQIGKDEEKFISTLSAEQLTSFHQLSDNRTEGHSMSIEDSFSFGFQLGAKFLIDVLC